MTVVSDLHVVVVLVLALLQLELALVVVVVVVVVVAQEVHLDRPIAAVLESLREGIELYLKLGHLWSWRARSRLV